MTSYHSWKAELSLQRMLPSLELNVVKSPMELFTLGPTANSLRFTMRNLTRWRASYQSLMEHRRWFYMSSITIERGYLKGLVMCRCSGLEYQQKSWMRLLTDSMPVTYQYSLDIQLVWAMDLTSKGRAVTSFGLALLGILSFMIKLLPECIDRVRKRIESSSIILWRKTPLTKLS